MSTTKIEAKKLHDLGFAILWLYPKSKRPIGEDWASGDRKSWQALEKEFKDAYNVGVRLGEPTKFSDGTYLCVLDVDVKTSDEKHLKELDDALMKFCPAHEFAPRVLSGRGGGSSHYYFRTKDPQTSFKAIRSTQKTKVFMPSVDASKSDLAGLTPEEIKQGYRLRLAWEVDVFGNGKQVVVPPSTHPDTLKAYAWEYAVKDFTTIPLHENFKPLKLSALAGPKSEIKFEDIDLFSAPLSQKSFDLIAGGKGFEDFPSRSEALFSGIHSLIKAGLTDAQIFTVLTDPSNFLSEKPLEAGQGSRESSAYWLSGQVAKARAEQRSENIFAQNVYVDDIDELLSDAEAEDQLEELVPWQSKLHSNKTGWKNTAHNLNLILRNLFLDEGSSTCLFAYDEFNQASIYTFAPPWGDASDIGKELTDLDDVRIKVWLSNTWGIEASGQSIGEIAFKLSKDNSFHPVQRYLNSLKWDGVPRVTTMLERYAGAVGEKNYLASLSKKFMVAAVARVFLPGVKFDHVLILEGDQGVGKSTFVSILAGSWYSDSLGDITNKDVIDNMRGKWLIEIGELSSMNRAETNDLKAFITRQADVNRKAYGKRSQTYPRQCIFIGTTNDDEYLRDATGGRRFWPVQTPEFDLELLKEDRDQLWAEALELYKAGEKLYLDNPEVRKYAEAEQSYRRVVDEIETKIAEYVKSEECLEEFSFEDVWDNLNQKQIGQKICDYPMQLRIKKALRALGHPKIRKRTDAGKGFYWLKNKRTSYKNY